MKHITSLNLVIGLLFGILWLPQVQASSIGNQLSQATLPSLIVYGDDKSDCEDFCDCEDD